jgi:hypothetical protein
LVTDLPTSATENWKFFVSSQLWPRGARFDVTGWLENFQAEELKFATRLLEGFTFFSTEIVEALFRGAFQNISQLVIDNKDNYFSASAQWNQFVDSAIVVRVEGRHSSDADSGFIFTRLARDTLGIAEDQILSPAKALERLRKMPRGNVVFVDDFVGSGEQFENTWNKIHQLSDMAHASFRSVVSTIGAGAVGFYYCPLVCTDKGRKHITSACPLVRLVPAHVLPESYSALSSGSVIWRDDMRIDGPEFVRTASEKAGIPDRDGEEGCWRGYKKLGLALAFSHGWPDAILPIFTHEANGWKPLLKA